MMGASRILRRTAGAALVAALFAPWAVALNPALDISQYAHTSWKLDEGFFKGAVHSVAQTPDGFLWLGTEFGLVRFDGVKAVEWPIQGSLPAQQVRSLLAGRDGTLWIGTAKGLVSLKDASHKVVQYDELTGQTIFSLVEDRAGNIWVAGWSASKTTLCSIGKGGTQCHGEDGVLGSVVGGLYTDRKDNLWIGSGDGVWRWSPGPRKLYSLRGESGFDALAEDGNGALLFPQGGAIKRLVDGHVEVLSRLPGATREFHVRRMLRDRDGGLWVGTSGSGLAHIHQGRTEMFTRTEGLSGEDITAMFEDRDGNIWVSNFNGLDRFRDTPVTTYSQREGLSSVRIVSVLAAKDGSIWMRTLDGLNRMKNREVAVYREHDQSITPVSRPDRNTSAVNGFREQGAGSLYEDTKGRIWVSTLNAVGYMENERFVLVRGVPAGRIHSITSDRARRMWFAHQDRGLFRWEESGAVQETAWSALGQRGFADVLAADPLEGGLWIGFFGGALLYFQDGRVLRSYTSADGLADGRINDFRIEADGTLWIATEAGLSRLKNGRIVTLTTKQGLPCNRVHWSIEDDRHSIWLYTSCGLLRVSRSELDAAAAAIEKDQNATVRIRPEVFDTSDGLRARANAGGFSPHVTKSPDGKLWFFPLDCLSSIDPARLPLDSLPPPVHIEQLRADRITRRYTSDPKDRVILPPLVRDLEIEYSALNIAAPEKLRFRYMLEGRDHDWTDAGTRRQAFYNDLPPGNYHFRVSATNSNIWNETGAVLDFAVTPAYYQARWFQAMCFVSFIGVLGVLYEFRSRRAARQFKMRVEERVAERTRIARDLHDTLLQSFQGVLLKFSTMKYVMRSRPDEAEETLERIIDQARAAITEGRDAVQGMRSSTVVANDLARAISTFGKGLAADQSGQPCPEFGVQVEGKSRDLPPLVRDEVYHIACESLRNAFRHAQAKRIEVEIQYDRRLFRLRVVDNGQGIHPAVLSAGGRAGHHGLPGIHERATLAGGQLAVRSELGSGTEIELTIPASIAYAKFASGTPVDVSRKRNRITP
jgi:signal transduction histidine kinase/ligand-binding sensor domain-containing protein